MHFPSLHLVISHPTATLTISLLSSYKTYYTLWASIFNTPLMLFILKKKTTAAMTTLGSIRKNLKKNYIGERMQNPFEKTDIKKILKRKI